MMDELIARIEAATKGSRELDVAICVALNQMRPEIQTAPHYTTSIDAALTLVPDSHAIDLARCPEMGCAVRVYEGPVIANSAGKPTSLGATPALAMCAAALKARKEKR